MVRAVAFVVVSLVVLGALWIVFKPQHPERPAQDVTRAGVVAAPASVREDVFDLTIKSGKLRSGPAVLEVHQGERVTLNIRSDSRDELHLHGYDLHAQLGPGETTSLQFIADRTGRFGMELHKVHSELGALEVYPQ
jgi:hypothetical protein